MSKLAQRRVIDGSIRKVAKGNKQVLDSLKNKLQHIHILRSVKALDETSSSFEFLFKQSSGGGQATPLDNRLSENDAFIAFGHKLELIRVPIVLPVGGGIEYQWGNAFSPVGYVDQNLFPASDRKALRRVYNGLLSFSVDGAGGKIEAVPPILTSELRYVPQQQYFEQTGTNRGFDAQFGGTDEIGDNGYTAFEPNINMLGSAYNSAKLDMFPGVSTGITGAAGDTPVSGSTPGYGFRNFVAVTLQGLLLKNAGAAELKINR